MNQPNPRFLDDDGPAPAVSGTEPPGAPLDASSVPDTPRPGPVLLEAELDGRGHLAAGWHPERIQRSRTRSRFTLWIPLGVGVLFLVWMLFSCLSVVLSVTQRSAAAGVAASLCMIGGLAVVLWGVVAEWRAYRRLRQVDHLRAALAAADLSPDAARSTAQAWVRQVAASLPDAHAVTRSLAGAASVAEIRFILRNRVVSPLEAAADQLGRQAALESAGLIAISPHASWDGLIAGIRSLRLIRQVASLYGLRPSTTVSLLLVRKVSVTAFSTAGIDLLSQTAADHILSTWPIAKHLTAALPGAGVAALRLYRLARITAAACSPVVP